MGAGSGRGVWKEGRSGTRLQKNLELACMLECVQKSNHVHSISSSIPPLEEPPVHSVGGSGPSSLSLVPCSSLHLSYFELFTYALLMADFLIIIQISVVEYTYIFCIGFGWIALS